MPYNYEWQSRIKAVEREYIAMRQAADRFQRAALDDPTILQGNLRHREIIAASRNLEGTYIIRLFAEFETAARQYWDANWATDPKTVDLLNGLAARCEIPERQRDSIIACANTETAWYTSARTSRKSCRLPRPGTSYVVSSATCRGSGDIYPERVRDQRAPTSARPPTAT